MARLLLVLSLLAACRFDASGGDGDDDGPVIVDAARLDAAVLDAARPIDASRADARPGTPDARPGEEACAAAGGTLVGGTCSIRCPGGAPGCELVRCPPDLPCEVSCGSGACACGVDCGQASSCSVVCDGKDACEAGVTCSRGVCHVDCLGEDACVDGVRCTGSSCDVTCDGEDACEGGACCGIATCPSSDELCLPTTAMCVGMCESC